MDKNGIGILIILALLAIGSCWVMLQPEEEEEEEGDEAGEETVETEAFFDQEVALGLYFEGKASEAMVNTYEKIDQPTSANRPDS